MSGSAGTCWHVEQAAANTQHSPSGRHCSWQSPTAGQLTGENCATHCCCIHRVPAHDVAANGPLSLARFLHPVSVHRHVRMSETLPHKQILPTRDRCWGLLWSHVVLQMYVLPSCVQSRCMHVMSRDSRGHPCIRCCPPNLLKALPPGG